MARTAVILDCSCLPGLDAAEIDVLARLQLALARHGCCLTLSRPTGSLCELLRFCGLADVLALELERQPEEREELLRVEEERQFGDAPI